MAPGMARLWPRTWCVRCRETEPTRLRQRQPKEPCFLRPSPFLPTCAQHLKDGLSRFPATVPTAAWNRSARCPRAPAGRWATELMVGGQPDQARRAGSVAEEPVCPAEAGPWAPLASPAAPCRELGGCTPNPWQGAFAAGEPEGREEDPGDGEDCGKHSAGSVRWGAPPCFPTASPRALLGSSNPIDAIDSTVAETSSIVFY